jgi:hypothetical protein
MKSAVIHINYLYMNQDHPRLPVDSFSKDTYGTRKGTQLLGLLVFRLARHAHKVDAVPVPALVRLREQNERKSIKKSSTMMMSRLSHEKSGGGIRRRLPNARVTDS